MNNDDILRQLLLSEHSKFQTMRIVQWIDHDPERAAALIRVFLEPDYRTTQRGAWVVRYVHENSPELLTPYLPELLNAARDSSRHKAVRRNVLNVFEKSSIPDSLLDELTDLSFICLADPQEDVAIRCAAMSILDKVCQRIPELREELNLLITEHIEHGSCAFKSRAKKILAAPKPPRRDVHAGPF